MAEDRFVTIESSLGAGALELESMHVQEGLSNPFRFQLQVLSTDTEIDLDALLGQPLTVKVHISDELTREFSGIVTSFALVGTRDRYARYSLTVRPWLWMLTQRYECRIFQQLSVPEIVKQVFDEHGFSDLEDSLSGSYRTLEYCVQYRESDFSFVCRLLEEEGIYYFFKHEGGKHTLVLADSVSAHATTSGYEEVPFFPAGEARRERDHFNTWRVSKRVVSAAYALTDFDFERPRAPLLTRRQATSPSYQAFEVFDYPGDYFVSEEGEQLAQVRLEEKQALQGLVVGSGPVAGLTAGGLFTLANFPRQDQNREYLIVSAEHSITGDSLETGDGARADYHCSLRAISSQEPFRPPRVTRRPVVEGPQTAIVVGKSGEEIWTDSHGRVKVQFHWDRYGERDENSSCWVRVAQIWAGSGFGGQFLPRIGQEVIVEFLEGNPDRPLITGRVYNGDNPHPYALPGNQTQSGVKTRSSKGGGASNANEIRLEDKIGEEQFYVQAEKDLDTVVKNCETHSVGVDRTITVGNDESHSIDNNQTITVAVNRTETVGGDESITVTGNRTESVGLDESLTVTGSQTESIIVDQTLTIGGSQTITVTGAVTETCLDAKTETVALAYTETVAGAKTVTVVQGHNETVGGSRSMDVTGTLTVTSKDAGSYSSKSVTVTAEEAYSCTSGKDFTSTSGQKMTLNADDTFSVCGKKKGVLDFADELTIKVGSATLVMKKSGDITLNGQKIDVKGSGAVTVKGSSVALN